MSQLLDGCVYDTHAAAEPNGRPMNRRILLVEDNQYLSRVLTDNPSLASC